MQKSICLRFQGDLSQSNAVLDDTLKDCHFDTPNNKLHYVHGRLLLSKAENTILCDDFENARSYLANWEIRGQAPSGLELKLLRMKNTTVGRLSRYLGQFVEAREILEQCLEPADTDGSHYHIMYHLADIYCETDASKEAEKLISAHIQQLRDTGKQSLKAFRRLGLSLIEVYIMQKQWGLADDLLKELLAIFDRIANPDVPDQLGQVRLMMARARVSFNDHQTLEARHALERALSLTECYSTFQDRSFYQGVVYLFLAVIDHRIGAYESGQNNLSKAQNIFNIQKPRFYMPGMGSYFLKDLQHSVLSLRWPETRD